MKSCSHKSVTYDVVLQGGQWFRATCSKCSRSSTFKPDKEAARAALTCAKVMVKR